jgi:hypothetical protein
LCLLVAAARLFAGDDLPRVDLHAHIDGETAKDKSLTPAEATAVSRRLNVRLGVLGEGGCGGDIRDDRTLVVFLDRLRDQPVWRGLQVYGLNGATACRRPIWIASTTSPPTR